MKHPSWDSTGVFVVLTPKPVTPTPRPPDPRNPPPQASSATLTGFYTAVSRGNQRKFQLYGKYVVNLSH